MIRLPLCNPIVPARSAAALYNSIMGSFQISRLRPILDWVPAILSVLIIALESTATMSADNTSRWLYPFWARFLGPISAAHWAELHHLIRKTGHFVGYGFVSVTFFYGWRQTFHRMAVRHWTLWRRASVARCSAPWSSRHWMNSTKALYPAGRARRSTSALIFAGPWPLSFSCSWWFN